LLKRVEKELPHGEEREDFVKVRIDHSFFCEMILASYRTRCAICSLPKPELLVASYIVPWPLDVSLRMSPQNGICIFVLHDKAFDKGLLSITDDYRLLLANTLKEFSNVVSVQRGFIVYEGHPIILPDRFLPDKECIRFHRENILAG